MTLHLAAINCWPRTILLKKLAAIGYHPLQLSIINQICIIQIAISIFTNHLQMLIHTGVIARRRAEELG